MLVGALLAAPFYVFIPDEGWVLQCSRRCWPLLYAWPIALAFVFPNGRLLTRRWRRVAIGGAACFVGFISSRCSDPEPFDPPDEARAEPDGRLDIPDWLEWIWVPLWLGIFGSLVAGAIAIRLRLRRSTGVERLQTLWVAWAACLLPLGLLTCFAGWGVGVPVRGLRARPDPARDADRRSRSRSASP